MGHKVMNHQDLDEAAQEWCEARRGSIAHVKGVSKEYYVARAFEQWEGLRTSAHGATILEACQVCDTTIEGGADSYLGVLRRRFATGEKHEHLAPLAEMVGVEIWPA